MLCNAMHVFSNVDARSLDRMEDGVFSPGPRFLQLLIDFAESREYIADVVAYFATFTVLQGLAKCMQLFLEQEQELQCKCSR